MYIHVYTCMSYSLSDHQTLMSNNQPGFQRVKVKREVNLNETVGDGNTCVICFEKLTVNNLTHIRQPLFNIKVM